MHRAPVIRILARTPLSAPRLPTAALAIRSHIHTSAWTAEEKRGFLSRLNPFAKHAPATPSPQTSAAEAARAAQDLNVEIEEEEAPIPSWKNERQSLTSEELQESIRSAALPFISSASDAHLDKVQLIDPKIKFQVLKACMVLTGQEIPSKDIASIHTLQDIVKVFQRLDQESQGLPSNPKGHVVAEWFQTHQSELPPNMVFIPYQKSKGVKAEDRKTSNKRFL